MVPKARFKVGDRVILLRSHGFPGFVGKTFSVLNLYQYQAHDIDVIDGRVKAGEFGYYLGTFDSPISQHPMRLAPIAAQLERSGFGAWYKNHAQKIL